MTLPQYRVPFSPSNPYRTKRPATSKIIFISCEGSVTEEEYFDCVSNIYSEIKSKIQIVSVSEDAIHTKPDCRTESQVKELSKVRPKQLVERIEKFKAERNQDFQFDAYPEDEFWIITDVDKNWTEEIIEPKTGKTYMDEWDDAVALCQKHDYRYAISNPQFEMWLLLHYADPTEEDIAFAVTDTHVYERTTHYRERLRKLGAPLHNKKHISHENFNDENIRVAIKRAEALHLNKEDLCPKYFATTVYLVLKKIIEMMPVR